MSISQDEAVRARVFRCVGPASYEFGGEVDAAEVDDVWRQLQDREGSAAPLAPGDIVHIGDLLELDGDGGWRNLPPDDVTRELYALATASESRRLTYRKTRLPIPMPCYPLSCSRGAGCGPADFAGTDHQDLGVRADTLTTYLRWVSTKCL